MSNKKIFGQHELNTLDQFDKISQYAVKSALMADGHYGYVMPVGGVAAFDNQVSVIGVGFDIACGNCAIKTDIKLEDITRHKITIKDATSNPYYIASDKKLIKIADEIADTISFGIGRSNLADDAPIDDLLFNDPAWGAVPNTATGGWFRDDLRDKARRQLGTVGSGNHYVDVFADEEGYLWVGVHFGSRGLGHTIASNFLAIGQGMNWGERGKEVETLLDLSTPTGQDYWALMELAGKYAYSGREWVTKKVISILGGNIVDTVHNHHNFAWKENHFIPNIDGLVGGENKDVVVVRKGATPAFPGQRGFVGGSMGDNAVILEGTDAVKIDPSTNESFPSVVYGIQQEALFSTVHGAGRIMSRTEAAGKWSRSGVQKKKGRVTQTMMDDWCEKKGVIRRGGGLDESPHVYRRLTDVLEAQGQTVKILHQLRPLIVVMAKANERDPYKD
jgi:tRNA-splicing ligase RtcB (3'-phosphate/5'-hydroxy nucleic acid ligase)